MAAHSSYCEEVPARAESLAASGADDRAIALKLGITDRTLRRWKLRHRALRQALTKGRAEAVQRGRGYREEAEAVAFLGEEPVVISLSHVVPLAMTRTSRRAA